MTLPMTATAFEQQAFAEWVEEQGWTNAKHSNEWEIARYKAPDGWHIVYKNKKDRISWTGESRNHYIKFQRGASSETVKPLTKSQRNKIRNELYERDGRCCWYCVEFFTQDDFATIEHLVPRSEGGGHALANLVLAHKSCNQEADNAPLARKIELRDRMQALHATVPPWESVRAA